MWCARRPKKTKNILREHSFICQKNGEKKSPPSSSFLTSPRNISHLIYLCYRCMYLLFTFFFFFFFNRRIKRFVFFQKTFHPCEEKKSDATRRDCKRWYESEKATVYDESSRVKSRKRETLYIFQLIANGRTAGQTVICSTRRLLLLNIFTHLYECHISDWNMVVVRVLAPL